MSDIMIRELLLYTLNSKLICDTSRWTRRLRQICYIKILKEDGYTPCVLSVNRCGWDTGVGWPIFMSSFGASTSVNTAM